MNNEFKSIEDFPDILTAKHVAEMLHMSLDYVRKLARENKIPSHKLPGGSHFRFFKSEIIEWLRSQGNASYDIGSPAGAHGNLHAHDGAEAQL